MCDLSISRMSTGGQGTVTLTGQMLDLSCRWLRLHTGHRAEFSFPHSDLELGCISSFILSSCVWNAADCCEPTFVLCVSEPGCKFLLKGQITHIPEFLFHFFSPNLPTQYQALLRIQKRSSTTPMEGHVPLVFQSLVVFFKQSNALSTNKKILITSSVLEWNQILHM